MSDQKETRASSRTTGEDRGISISFTMTKPSKLGSTGYICEGEWQLSRAIQEIIGYLHGVFGRGLDHMCVDSEVMDGVVHTGSGRASQAWRSGGFRMGAV